MLDRTYQNLEMSFWFRKTCVGSSNHIWCNPLWCFPGSCFRIPGSDSISDFAEICLWQDGQRLQMHGVFWLNRCWSSPSLFFSCFASSQGRHPLPHFFIVKSDNPAKNCLKINSDSRSRAMKFISCPLDSSILEKSIISMKTACSSSPGPGLLVAVLWEKLSFIPEIHFLAGRGFSAILTQVLLSKPIAPDSEKTPHPKHSIFSAECFFWRVFFVPLWLFE